MDSIFNYLIKFGKFIFMYCTDFIINVANLTGTSYYEVNAFIFVILWPMVTIVLLSYYLYLSLKWRKIKAISKTSNPT